MADELDGLAGEAAAALGKAHEAREVALRCCRSAIQCCGRSIRATHRGETEAGAELAEQARRALDQAQGAATGFPSVAGAGFVHDAEKEYAEAALFACLVARQRLRGHVELGVGPAAWLNGLAEAASELRRHILDTLRRGDLDHAEACLGAMDEVYGVLIGVDYPDAVTGGLRRTTDALRAVLERTRSDLTTTALQSRLQASIDRALAVTEPGGAAGGRAGGPSAPR